MQLLAKVIAKAGTDATKAKEKLYAIKNFDGATGSISFDSFGERTSAAYQVFVVRNGKFVPFE